LFIGKDIFTVDIFAVKVLGFLSGEQLLKESFDNGPTAPEAPFPLELINFVEEGFAEF